MASIGDQNWVVWNQGKNPLVNFNFMLRVELVFDLPCKSVRAFQRELEYDYIQEGGLNDYVHMRRKPISRPFTLEIERYVGVDYVDPLPLGADLTLPLMLFVSRSHSQFIPGVVARTYVFTGCTVMKKTYGDLVADQAGLLVETTTIGYREMLCVDIPWSEAGDNITKSVETSPTNAATQDSQAAAELKMQGQNAYQDALEARDDARTVYDDASVQTLIGEIDAARQKVHAAVNDGTLQKEIEAAEADLRNKDGKELRQAAEEKAQTARQKEQAARTAAADWGEMKNVLQTAKNEVEKAAAKTEADAAEAAYQKAYEEWQTAQDEADKAEAEWKTAENRVETAKKAMENGRKQLTRLQNSLTNLKAWKEKGKQAQDACSNQHDQCKTANDKLQDLPDEPLSDVNRQLEEVRKTSRETVSQGKQVRQAQQYVDAARQELTETKKMLPAVFDA